jgi:hypothetical protein
MSYILMLLGLLMVAFAGVQYNDPDALLWIVLYLVPAAWAFAAAFRPAALRSLAAERLLWTTIAIGMGTLVFYWPSVPGFWRKEVWWVEETAREGMGVMIGFVVLGIVLATVMARSRRS